MRPSFGPLLARLAPPQGARGGRAGRPLGGLARELAISKQACSQLASLVEAAGYLERRPNPLDGRSKVLVLTSQGAALVAAAKRIVRTREDEYADVLGRTLYERWIGALNSVFLSMRLAPGAPGRSLDAADSGRTTETSRATVAVLPLIVDRLQQQIMEETMAKGHPGLKRSYAQILLLIGPDGGRVAEMARLQAVSRQAMSAVSLEIESLGYLRRAPDPVDGRSHVLEFTRAGRALIADSVETVTGIEAALEGRLGPRSYASLLRASSALYHALGLEASVFHRTDQVNRTQRERNEE